MKIYGKSMRTIWVADDSWGVEIIDQPTHAHTFAGLDVRLLGGDHGDAQRRPTGDVVRSVSAQGEGRHADDHDQSQNPAADRQRPPPRDLR